MGPKIAHLIMAGVISLIDADSERIPHWPAACCLQSSGLLPSTGSIPEGRNNISGTLYDIYMVLGCTREGEDL